MSFLTNNLIQTAVYWGSPTSDGYGSFTFDAPLEINVRWEDRTQLFIDRTGAESKSLAVVYLGQDVDIGGWLFLGELADIDSGLTDTPHLVPDAREIRGFKKIPSLDAEIFHRKTWL